MTNLTQFTAQLDRFAELVRERGDLLVKGFVQTMANEMHSGGRYSPGTPIANPSLWKHPRPHTGGFARANWDAGLNAPPDNGPAASPGESLARMEAVAFEAKPGDVVYLRNTAPYIRVLEFDGHSKQAPDGFVRPALNAAQLILDEVAEHLRSKGGR